MVVLILSTSFQNGRNEMVRIESEYLVPGLIRGLKITLSDTGASGPAVLQGEDIALFREVRQYYDLHGFKPTWTSYNHLNENGENLINMLEHAREYGLEPDHYHLTALRQMQVTLSDKASQSNQGKLRENTEILLTDAALKFMVNLHSGYRAFDTTLFNASWIGTLPGILLDGIKQGRLIENILRVQPRFIEYTQLRQATGNFIRQTELTDDWQKITDPGKDTMLFISQVKQILMKLGYVDGHCRDQEIIAGLKEFQLHHGLEPDGKAGKNTMEALKMTTMYHYRMLALNLDRLRKQDHSESNLFYVNIPSYRLKIFKENRLEDIYRVIVGNSKTPTPQFNSMVIRIITNPSWDVPQSITRNELIPKIKADSGYMKRNRLRLVDKYNRTIHYESIDPDRMTDEEFGYRLRQDANSDNALGRVKFIFENPYAVYLHDTPGKTLFSKDIRALSHGCIRVQNPEKLADYIVKVTQSDSTDISRLIERGIHREINLVTAIPIHISYITCDTDEKGNLFFYPDIYGIDQKELVELSPFMDI